MIRTILLLIAAAMITMTAAAQNDWLHIHHNNKVSAYPIEEIERITHDKLSQNDSLFESLRVTVRDRDQLFDLGGVDSVVIGTNVPTMYIDIAEGEEVVSKELYLDATVSVRGWGEYEDLEPTEVTIKGRGNSTWNMPKKPYRLKFKKKQSICGMAKAKNYVLLANYIDCTLMRNAVALKLAQLMGLEYTNHFIPVNLVVNGIYRGSYLMTEKIGINGASVDIDETKGILFELDSNFDEPYEFRSEKFGIPVMVKDPDFDELAEDDPSVSAEERLALWQEEFGKLEQTLNPGGGANVDFVSQIDVTSLARYILVNAVCGNRELNHPKSVYLYKDSVGQPFKMGPVWDFDWAFTFDGAEGSGRYDRYLLINNYPGGEFFLSMARSAEFKAIYQPEWERFKTEVWPQLLQFMSDYADTIRVTAYQNGEIWPSDRPDNSYSLKSTDQFDENYATLVDWMNQRIDWLDRMPNNGIYVW